MRTRVFLDGNVWNMLVDGACPFGISELTTAYRQGYIEIVATLELFEEILGTAVRRPAKYLQMRQLFFKLVGRRILLPLSVRIEEELRVGALLPEHLRYERAANIRTLRHLGPGNAAVPKINHEVHRRKRARAISDRQMKADVLDEIRTRGLRMKQIDRSRVSNEVVRDLAAGVLRDHVGPPAALDEQAASLDRVPTLWLFCAASVAHLSRTAGDNRRIQESDEHDRLHCAAGGYFDLLVTDDAEFRATLALIDHLPFLVDTPAEFAARLAAR